MLSVLNPMPVAIAAVAKMAVFYSAEIYKISKALEATEYKQLKDEAKHIFEQMDLVEKHLEVIVDCLMDINLRYQFHQRLTSSFFARRSQKYQMTLLT